MSILSQSKINSELEELSTNWTINHEGRLVANIKGSNFRNIIELVNKIAEVAESENHHPDLLVHSYKNLAITLYTHSENGLTQKDFNLAKKIDVIIV